MSEITAETKVELLKLISTNIDSTSCNARFLIGFRNDLITYIKSLFVGNKVISDKMKEHPTEPANDINLTGRELYTIFCGLYEDLMQTEIKDPEKVKQIEEKWSINKANLDDKYKDALF